MDPTPPDPGFPGAYLAALSLLAFLAVTRDPETGEPIGRFDDGKAGRVLVMVRGDEPGLVEWAHVSADAVPRDLAGFLVTFEAHRVLSRGLPDGKGGIAVDGRAYRIAATWSRELGAHVARAVEVR
jgi:hypothetical protein